MDLLWHTTTKIISTNSANKNKKDRALGLCPSLDNWKILWYNILLFI